MIEASDSTSPACLNAVGAYRAAVASNADAEQNLQSSQLDTGDDTNSEVQQLNLVNAAQARQLVEMKQQGMLHACLAQQMAVANMQQRNSAIPGVGSSLKGFINGGAQNLVGLIGTDSTDSIMNTLSQAQQNAGPGMVASFTQPYLVLVYAITQVLLGLFSALTAAIIGYCAVASTIIGLLGPIFIPFLVFDKLEFLFWGWLKAYLSFAFYKVVAAAALSVLGHVITAYYTNFVSANDPATMVENFPLLLLLIITNIFILLEIPALTASIFSGSSSGHDGGMGMITTAIAALG